MKRVNFFLVAALVVASAMLFVSCSDDDDPMPPDVSVKYVLSSAPGTTNTAYINGEIEAEEGEIIDFTITFTQGSNKLRDVLITSLIDNKTFQVLDTTGLDKGFLNLKGGKFLEWPYTTNVGKKQEKLTFLTRDSKENEAVFTLTIKAPEPPEPEPGDQFIFRSIVLLGGQTNATAGSFYSVNLGKVLTVGAATSQSSYVDFAYYYGSNNKATIAAPGNSDAQTISYGSTRMSSWSTKNVTRFFKSTKLSVTDLEELNDALNSLWEDGMGTVDSEPSDAGACKSHANELAANELVFFKTAGGIKGAFVVEKVTGTQSGSIEITLIEKVEE